MARTLLILTLILSLALELGISFAAIASPDFALHMFRIEARPDTRFLGYVVGWLCLFVSIVCALVLVRVLRRKPDYALIGNLLGVWWIGIGAGIFLTFGKPDNLWMDSLKGLLIVILINRTRAGERKTA